MTNKKSPSKTILKQLRTLAKQASRKAHSPYSKVNVGAALQASSGEIFSGCNIENSSFGGTVCAEQVAILKAVSEGHKKIVHMYVYTKDGWPPCGLCRQMMSEFSDNKTLVTIGNEKGEEKTYKFFEEVLPLAFTPQHLNCSHD